MKFGEKVKNLEKGINNFKHRFTKHCRSFLAVVICVSLILSGFPASLLPAFATDEGEDYIFELDRSSIYEALDTAIAKSTTLDSELKFLGEHKEEYDELFEPDGTLYELKDLKTDKDKERDRDVELRVFARIEGDIRLDEAYEADGTEKVLFLLANKTDNELSVRIVLDDCGTEVITIPAAKDIPVEINDEHSVTEIDDKEESGETSVSGETKGSSGGTGSGGTGKYPDTESAEEENSAKDDDSENVVNEEVENSTLGNSASDDESSRDEDSAEWEDSGKESDESADSESEKDAPSDDGTDKSGTDNENETDKDSRSDHKDSSDDGNDSENGNASESSGNSDSDGNTGSGSGSDDGADSGSSGDSDTKSSGGSDTKSSGGGDTGSSGGSDTGSSGGSDSGSDGGSGSDSNGGSDSGSNSGSDSAGDKDSVRGSGQTAAVSAKHTNMLSASIDSDSDYIIIPASPSDATRQTASSSDADRAVINGDLYDPVRFGEKRSAVAFATTAEELGLDKFVFLGEQTISADIYEDSSYKLISTDDAQITLSGRMPVNAEVKAYPVDVDIEGLNIIAAYDITIFDRNDREFEPDDEIEVVMDSDEIREALESDDDLFIYHMKDESAEPEEVTPISSDDDVVSFLADRFSVYLLASGVMPLADGDTAFAIYSADDKSLTFYAGTTVPTAGATYPASDGKTVTNVYTGFDEDEYTGTSSSTRPPWYSQRTSITSVTFDESFENVQPLAMAFWFYGFTNLTDINADYLDTSNVTTLKQTFYNCSSLTSVDGLADWDTSNVTTLYYTFRGCSSLTNVDGLADWDTSKVTTLYYTFYNCSSLTNVDGLADWDTSKVTTLYYTFYNCSSLTDVDGLANWDTSNVTTLEDTFYGCSSLTNADGLVKWDTSNVTTLHYTFRGCSSLTNVAGLTKWDISKVTTLNGTFYNCNRLSTVDVSNWDTSNVTNMGSMFYDCSRLKTIYSDDKVFVTTSVTSGSSMFYDCKFLVGGSETVYSSSSTSYSMAHVDATDNPGYFTAGSGLEIYKYTGDIVYDEVYGTWGDYEEPLSGAEFELRDGTDETAYTAWFSEETTDGKTVYTFVSWTEPTDGGDYTQTLISGSDGMIYVYGLPAGTYYLYETKAPSGYNLLAEPVMVVVTDDGTGRVNVKNNIRSLLPYTGGPGIVLLEMLGVLLMGSALIYFMALRRRRS